MRATTTTPHASAWGCATAATLVRAVRTRRRLAAVDGRMPSDLAISRADARAARH